MVARWWTFRASADSEVRPGPRFPTLRPYHAKTAEAGPEPEALPTSSLPTLGLMWTFRQVLAVIFCWRWRSGWVVADVVRPAEEAGERCQLVCKQRGRYSLQVHSVWWEVA